MENRWEDLDIKIRNEKINLRVYKKFICVCGGGINNDDGYPHDFVTKRLDSAIKIFNSENENEKPIILVLGGGTYHKFPYINKDKFVVHESTSCAKYLYEKGIPSHNIYREWSSYDTIANGFFAFTNYINYLDIDDIVVISSDFHISRVKVIFNYFNKLFKHQKNIQYLETKSHLDIETKNIRCKRENKSRENFINNIVKKIHSPSQFINWFYTEHKAYMSIVKYKINNKINKTY